MRLTGSILVPSELPKFYIIILKRNIGKLGIVFLNQISVNSVLSRENAPVPYKIFGFDDQSQVY